MRSQPILLAALLLFPACDEATIQEAPEAEGDDPGECTDDADNDQDGDFDCDDADCAGSQACGGGDDDDSAGDDDDASPPPYEGDDAGECSDGADNDLDGDFDCDDEGCVGSPDCDDTGGGELFFGNAFLFTEEDMDAFCEQYTGISGSLTVQYSYATAIEMPCLEYVGRSVQILDSNLVEAVTFPALAYVGGLLKIDECDGLQDVSFPVLEGVGFSDLSPRVMDIDLDIPSAVSVDLGALVEVESGLKLVVGGGTTTLDLGVLEAVGAYLQVAGGGPDVQLPALTSVGAKPGDLSERGMQVQGIGGATISAPLLASIGGSLEVSNNTALTQLGFGTLGSVGGSFNILNNPNLPTSTAEALADQVEAGGGIGEPPANISGNGPG